MKDSEVVRILRDLLRFDTTNPPGNETACARYLAQLFEREGIACQVPNRPQDAGMSSRAFRAALKRP